MPTNTTFNGWKPIVTDTSLRLDIQNTLGEIKLALDKNLDLQNIPSFFFGSLSISLYYAYWCQYDSAKITPQIQAAVYELVEKSIDHINTGEGITSSYVEGISGIAWALNHLHECGLLDDEIEDCMVDFDQIVLAALNDNLQRKNLDLLYGAAGNLNYLLARVAQQKIDESVLQHSLIQIETILTDPKNGVLVNYKKHEILFGYAHGYAALLSVLCKIARQIPQLAMRCKHVFEAIYEFISLFRMPDACHYTFPNLIEYGKAENSSPLRWCHGELGLAVALAFGGQTFNHTHFKNEAIKIGLKAAARRNLRAELVEEFGMCHGTAGNAHLFARLFNYTNEPIFKNASYFWLQETLKMKVYPDGLAGFKVKSPKGDWVNSVNFLNGISGMGLALMASITNLNPKWDNCLLMS